jgi:hypothetical protein
MPFNSDARIHTEVSTAAFSRLNASRPRNEFNTPRPRRTMPLQGTSTAFIFLLHCEFRVVFSHLGSAVCVLTYDFAVFEACSLTATAAAGEAGGDACQMSLVRPGE